MADVSRKMVVETVREVRAVAPQTVEVVWHPDGSFCDGPVIQIFTNSPHSEMGEVSFPADKAATVCQAIMALLGGGGDPEDLGNG